MYTYIYAYICAYIHICVHIFNSSYSILKGRLYFYRPNYGKIGASQAAPVVKNLPASAGDVRNVA